MLTLSQLFTKLGLEAQIRLNTERDAEPFMPIPELQPVLRITLLLLSTTKLT